MWEYSNCPSLLWCFHTKIPQNGWFINNKSLFPTVLEARNSIIGVVVVPSGSGESPLWGCRLLMCRWVTYGGRAGDLSHTSFIRALIPFIGLCLHDLVLSQYYPLILSLWSLGFQHMNFWGTQTFNQLHQPNELEFHITITASYKTYRKQLSLVRHKCLLSLFINEDENKKLWFQGIK